MSVMSLRTVILLCMMFVMGGLSGQVTMTRALTLYDSGDPTPEEQLVLEYINRARADPTAEGTRLGINIWDSLCDLNDVGVRPPLAMNKILLQVSDYHSWNMYTSNYFDHNDSNGHNPGQRMINAGYSAQRWSENIAVGSSDCGAANLQDSLMVDSSTSCRLHRVNLFNENFREVGVGYYSGATPNPSGWSNFLTQDLGASSVGPFLVGVVYNDADGDRFYDIGEGISEVQITPSGGSFFAISSTSGGYAFPIGTSGTITVTALGSGFGSLTKTVSFTGANMKLDFQIGNYTAEPTTTTAASANSKTSTAATATTIKVFTSTASSTSTASTTSKNAMRTTTIISTTEISELQYSDAVLLIAVVGLYAAICRKDQAK